MVQSGEGTRYIMAWPCDDPEDANWKLNPYFKCTSVNRNIMDTVTHEDALEKMKNGEQPRLFRMDEGYMKAEAIAWACCNDLFHANSATGQAQDCGEEQCVVMDGRTLHTRQPAFMLVGASVQAAAERRSNLQGARCTVVAP